MRRQLSGARDCEAFVRLALRLHWPDRRVHYRLAILSPTVPGTIQCAIHRADPPST